jgi:hypothetical protein
MGHFENNTYNDIHKLTDRKKKEDYVENWLKIN